MTPLSEKGFKILNRMNRKMPDYLSPVWQGFDEPTTDECLLGENFSIYLNPKHLGIGAGVGALAGLSYGYWDYNDAKKQAAKKGLQKPDKKKILIRDTLIGLGLGTAASPLATMFLNILENKKVSQEQKNTFDKLEQDILKGHDKNKLMAHLNNYKNKLAPDQYNTLKTLVDAHTEHKKDEPKKYIPPAREMSYKERMERLEDSMPSPLNENGTYNMDAINKIQESLPPNKASQYLNKFGIKMKDAVKDKYYAKKTKEEMDKIEAAAKIAKQQPTIVPDPDTITDPVTPQYEENTSPMSQEEIQAQVDAEFEKAQNQIDSTASTTYKPSDNKNKARRKSNRKKGKSNVSKTTSDLADALFGAYFSNKAQIFRNYNAQKKRW